MQIYALYLGLGAIAGLLSGIFGIGGGAIIVPVLIYSFVAQGYSPEVLTHLAIGTSLATIVVTSASAVATHHRKRAVRWPLALWMAPGIGVGTALGGLFAATLSGPLLQLCFGVFLLGVAAQLGLGLQPRASRQVPGRFGTAGTSLGIGFLSGIFGIGGGSISVPFLVWCRIGMAQAVATSAALGFPIAVSGAVTYLLNGWAEPGLPAGAVGYLHLPALFGIALASTPSARAGALLAHRLPANLLKKLFVLLLVALGLSFVGTNVPTLLTPDALGPGQ